ncbi:FtsX-like permease family protein [Streptomyces sp. NPDC029003]|uniref:ABC transporter permease n=1 Tax=Streptomyces sp. NPDC029003 TaxID=3155125 RepID=UPI0033DF98EB
MSSSTGWIRDLAMGVRFAFGGGREGWTRTALTGLGIGLGVALLLISTAVPSALAARAERGEARFPVSTGGELAPGPDTLLMAGANMTYRNRDIDGRLVRAEGPRAPLPPGLASLPKPGEMAVSPALRELLASGEHPLLQERFERWKPTQTIGDAGLTGPGDLYFYAGSADLHRTGPQDYATQRVNAFNQEIARQKLDPVLLLLIVLTFVALLLPVAVFIATAVRFGGERRDRRLAALRLVGADSRMVRRIAAGEALAGSVVGLGLGAVFFLLGRTLVGSLTLGGRSVFPADLNPTPWLAVLVACAVPAAAVGVTLFALRGVVIEPLGVVRTAKPRKRRIWWRLLLPLAGLGLLAPLTGRGNDHGRFNTWQVSGGVVLLLIGITALLPWLLERLVGAISGGPVSWQLAVRRLQVDSGGAARLANGIAVAVAGAIALQMTFAGAEGSYTKDTGQDPGRATISILVPSGHEAGADSVARQVAAAPGIIRTVPVTGFSAARAPKTEGDDITVTVGTCEALAELARLDGCADGDAFALNTAAGTPDPGATARPGERLYGGNVHGFEGIDGAPAEAPVAFTFPAGARTATPREDPTGNLRSGLLLTPSAAPKRLGFSQSAQIYVQVDESRPDGLDRARTAAFKADPLATAMTLKQSGRDGNFSAVRTGLFFGAAGVMILIGSSLLVSQLEQLRERRRLLSALVAFGTKRSTLSVSVLWQTALPIGLGLGLATGIGVALGSVLLRMANQPVRVDWTSVLAMTGVGGGVVALVTLLSLPPLLRLMRPEGLRTE